MPGKSDIHNPKPADAYDGRFLKLDQTIPETVEDGTPTFDEGITANATGNTAITANKNIILKSGRRLYFDGV